MGPILGLDYRESCHTRPPLGQSLPSNRISLKIIENNLRYFSSSPIEFFLKMWNINKGSRSKNLQTLREMSFRLHPFHLIPVRPTPGYLSCVPCGKRQILMWKCSISVHRNQIFFFFKNNCVIVLRVTITVHLTNCLCTGICFQYFAVTNNATMNNCVMLFLYCHIYIFRVSS